MKTILFISYEFPPLSRAGVYRSIGFAKYLEDFGIKPIIITLAEADFPKVYGDPKLDQTIGAELRNNIEKIEVSSNKIYNEGTSGIRNFAKIFFYANGREAKGWTEDFSIKIDAAIDRYKPIALLITAPPFSIISLAARAAKKHNIPLITDFRDAMSQWNINPFGTYLHYLITLKNEKHYLKSAAAIVATSKQTLSDFKDVHKDIHASKFHYIPNGFEGALEEWTSLPEKQTYSIGYVGSFYYSPLSRENMLNPWWKKKGHKMLQYSPNREDWLYRSPYFFFRSLSYFFKIKPEWRERIKVKFAGAVPEWLPPMVEEFSLQDLVELKGMISHEESLRFQKECDALLITSSKKINGKDYSIAGKTFEYFKSQKPIIAFVAEGAQKDILAESGMALICDPDETESSAGKLKDFFERTTVLKPDHDFIEGFERRKLTRQLADIILNSVEKRK